MQVAQESPQTGTGVEADILTYIRLSYITQCAVVSLSLLLSAWTGQGAIQTGQQDGRMGGSKALSTSPLSNQINQEQNKEKRCVDKVV